MLGTTEIQHWKEKINWIFLKKSVLNTVQWLLYITVQSKFSFGDQKGKKKVVKWNYFLASVEERIGNNHGEKPTVLKRNKFYGQF